jgi:hypothetical protein
MICNESRRAICNEMTRVRVPVQTRPKKFGGLYLQAPKSPFAQDKLGEKTWDSTTFQWVSKTEKLMRVIVTTTSDVNLSLSKGD